MKPKIERFPDGSLRTIEIVRNGELHRPYPWPFPVSVGSDGRALHNVCPRRMHTLAETKTWPWELTQ